MTTAAAGIGQKELPSGWEWAKLGDIVEQLKPGELHSLKSVSTEGSVPVVSQSETGFIGYHDDPPGIHASVNEPIVTFANHTCAVRLHTYPFSTIQNVFPFRAKANSDVDFLYWLLRGRVPTTFYGGHMPVLRTTDLPLPPLGEQKRIAGILNEQMAAVEEAKKAAQERLEAAQALPAAYLREVFPSSEDELPAGWKWVKLGDVCYIKGGNTLPNPDECAEKDRVHLVKVSGLSPIYCQGKYLISSASYTSRSVAKTKELTANSIVFPKRGGAIATNRKVITSFPTVLDPNLMGLEPMNPRLVDIGFIYFWMQGFDLSSIQSGSSVPQINRNDLFPLNIPLPPLEEQQRITSDLDDKIAGVKLAETSIQQELDTIEAMPAALLRKAFSGGI